MEDRFIPLSNEEGDLYSQVETYISETYNAAAPDARNAVGFVMTIYRRRLASSFHALRQTMEKRKGGVGGLLTAADEARIDENIADQVEAGEEIDIEVVSEDERRALAFEEIATIETIVNDIKRLPTDTKAIELAKVLSELKGSGYPQVMVFTQFTDTMDYLRDLLVGAGNSVMCFSGRGGEVRNTDGTWTLITRDEVNQLPSRHSSRSAATWRNCARRSGNRRRCSGGHSSRRYENAASVEKNSLKDRTSARNGALLSS